MKIVITNDDGHDQPGLAALAEAVRPLGEVIVVAPATPQSNVGHQVTMKAPLRVEACGRNRWVVHGTPADCTRLALKCLAPAADWLIAGINPGANLGSDVYQSGTVAAAREAAILGVRAIAVSQYIAPGWTVDWEAAGHHAAQVLRQLIGEPLEVGQFWNVNLPSPITTTSRLEPRFCHLDRHPHRYRFVRQGDDYHYEGIIHDRPRSAGSDVAVCFGGAIAVTRMEI